MRSEIFIEWETMNKNFMPSTKKTLAMRLIRAFDVLDQLKCQTAVHRKKFEYVIQLLKDYLDFFDKNATDELSTPEEVSMTKEIIRNFSTLRDIFRDYSIHDWADETLHKPINTICDQLTALITDFKNAVSLSNPEHAHFFDIDPKKWKEYHVIDLNCIQASFMQVEKCPNLPDEDVMAVQFRVTSIIRYFAENEDIDEKEGLQTGSLVPEAYHHWIADISRFKRRKTIGSGLSAEVYLANDKETGKMVAIKQLNDYSGIRIQFFQREIAVLDVLSRDNSPYFVKMVAVTDLKPFTIIMEYAPNGCLASRIRSKTLPPMGPLEKTIAAFDIARGIQVMHRNNIIHRDIKSLNVLLDEFNHCKIADFGFAKYDGDLVERALNLGTPYWMAPELIANRGCISKKADIYSYAIVLCELVLNSSPYTSRDVEEIREAVVKQDLRPELPPDVHPTILSLITQCWDKDPNVRPSIDEIVRRFKAGQVYFEGTDLETFLDYVKSTDDENQKPKDMDPYLEKLEQGEMTLVQYNEHIGKSGIPQELIEQAFAILPKLRDRVTDKEEMSMYLSHFFKTPHFHEVVNILKQYPKKSIPKHIIKDMLSYYPTGDSENDFSIVITASRNDCAAACATLTTDPEHLLLLMEVLIASGMSLQWKKKIINMCYKLLDTCTDVRLLRATFRLIFSMKYLNDLDILKIMNFTNHENESIAQCALAVVLSYSINSDEISQDLIESIWEKFDSDKCCASICIIACKKLEIAKFLLEKIKDHPESLNKLKLLMMCSKFNELIPTLKEIPMEFTDYPEEIKTLKSIIEKEE